MQTDTAKTLSAIRSLPADVYLAVFAMIATSSYVVIEPAPCDVAFVVFAPFLFLLGRFAIIRPMNPLLYAGLALFFVMNLISMAVALEVWVSARYFAITVYLILFWLLIVSLVAKYGPTLYRLINTSFQYAAILTSTVAVLARFKIIPNYQQYMLTEFGYRVKSTFKDANVLGPFLVAAGTMVLADIIVRKRVKLWQVGCLFLYGSAILLTFSRGAYLAGAVSTFTLGFLFWLTPRYRRSTDMFLMRMVPVFFLLALGSAFVLQKTNLTNFFFDRFAYQSYDDIRFQNQQHILETVGTKPVGIGPGGWNLHHYLHDVHSLFLRTWVESGSLALIGLLAFLLAWFVSVWSKIRENGKYVHIYIVSFAVVLGVMSNSFSIDTVHWRHLFLFLAIPIGLMAYQINRDGESTDVTPKNRINGSSQRL